MYLGLISMSQASQGPCCANCILPDKVRGPSFKPTLLQAGLHDFCARCCSGFFYIGGPSHFLWVRGVGVSVAREIELRCQEAAGCPAAFLRSVCGRLPVGVPSAAVLAEVAEDPCILK